ncbi:hypothetical protein B0H11DRAFT_1937751 [Mycena galericulata]|nr:hypothetical protein B0H11DRAFT_1937751 [Mycena galericulata]
MHVLRSLSENRRLAGAETGFAPNLGVVDEVVTGRSAEYLDIVYLLIQLKEVTCKAFQPIRNVSAFVQARTNIGHIRHPSKLYVRSREKMRDTRNQPKVVTSVFGDTGIPSSTALKLPCCFPCGARVHASFPINRGEHIQSPSLQPKAMDDHDSRFVSSNGRFSSAKRSKFLIQVKAQPANTFRVARVIFAFLGRQSGRISRQYILVEACERTILPVN